MRQRPWGKQVDYDAMCDLDPGYSISLYWYFGYENWRMMMRIAINGFGRIGRSVFKIAFERPGIDIVAVNDVTDAATLVHLLQYDSTYGIYNRPVRAEDDVLTVGDESIAILTERKPEQLPWKNMGIDVVIESTGLFRAAEEDGGGYMDHIRSGAKRVILTAPAKDEIDKTIVLGVNDEIIDNDARAYSNASCTTNCLAPVVRVLHDSFGLEQGFMTAIHAYTGDQVLMDGLHNDPRRARAAALNIIPTSTGAALSMGKVIPPLAGRLDGMAMRTPISTGSAVDLTALLSTDVTSKDINEAMRNAAEGDLKGILEYSEAPLVSSDIRGNSHSAIFDAGSTMVLGHRFVKVIAWYDNEFGYATRVVDLAQKLI